MNGAVSGSAHVFLIFGFIVSAVRVSTAGKQIEYMMTKRAGTTATEYRLICTLAIDTDPLFPEFTAGRMELFCSDVRRRARRRDVGYVQEE